MSSHFTGGNLKTVAKLLILEWYLEQYVNIMEKNWDEYWYVDTHAGTGRTECDNGKLVDGSAIRVIESYGDKFDRFYFYELNEDHFRTLVETLSNRFGLDFEVIQTPEGSLLARNDKPYIRILQKDSNEGVSWLTENARSDTHWFTFVDPKGLTVKKSTLDSLIERGNMDILINYQTSGVMRNAAESATHAHGAVTRTLGDDDWPTDGSGDDYVSLYKEALEQNQDWEVRTKNMQDPRDPSYRFDLVFASANETGVRIMEYIMDERDDLWEKASDELGQSGFSQFT